MEFEWYEECVSEDNSLQQGDFIPECPIVIPPVHIEEGSIPEIDVQQIDSIILTQSCDLVSEKISIVLVCPFYPLKHWLDSMPIDQQSAKGRRRAIDDIRKGHRPGYHVLNKQEEGQILEDYQVVDFRNVYGINYNLLKDIVAGTENRIRLLPPYREHLSQAFARYFMRVGLPQDLRIEY